MAAPSRWVVLVVSLAGEVARAEDSGVFPMLGGSVGATFDSNVTRTAVPQGDVSLDLGASGGVGWTSASRAWGLSALALYRGRAWATAIDWSTHVLAGSGLVSWAPLEWLVLGLAPSGGYTLAVDLSRNGPRFDARAFVKVLPADWLQVRVGYGYLWRDAVDPVFSTQLHDVSALVRVIPLDWLAMSASATYSAGDDVVFRDSSDGTGTTSTRRGARWGGTSSTTTYEAQQVFAHTVAVSAGAEVLLPKGFSVSADLAWVTSFNDVQPWSSWMPSVLLAWDLP